MPCNVSGPGRDCTVDCTVDASPHADATEEAPVNSWYQWTAPVRNLAWVAAHFGHR
jgi:hypothetical protein